MDYYEELVAEYSEADAYPEAEEYPDYGYAEYTDTEYFDSDEGYIDPEEELVASNNLLDYLSAVSLSLPVVAVIFIGVCLVFLTSFINYGQAAEFASAHNVSTALTSLNQSPEQNTQKKAITGRQSLPPMFTPQILYWEAEIIQWAEEQGVAALLAATVMQIESCGHPDVVSSVGAMGLFQVMPYHFQQDENGFDPATNARRGLAYLRQALDAHQGDTRLALAGYNGGIAGSSRPESAWPAETQRYVYWGTGIYADALAGAESSSRLQEWLAAGGQSLCNRASQALGLP